MSFDITNRGYLIKHLSKALSVEWGEFEDRHFEAVYENGDAGDGDKIREQLESTFVKLDKIHKFQETHKDFIDFLDETEANYDDNQVYKQVAIQTFMHHIDEIKTIEKAEDDEVLMDCTIDIWTYIDNLLKK